MLTPRRSLMLLAGFALFGCAYAAYSTLLGWIDGLPQLPAAMLKPSDGTFRPPPRTISPTQARLAQAFGPTAPEVHDSLYQNQFSFVNGDTVIVLASGPVPAAPNSTRVPLSPFSLAIFAKPKPLHLRQPGEEPEITTIHSDKAVLEFDRTIATPNDMRSAKLLRMELVSDIEQTFDDPRRGTVHIVNNQRSADPNRALVVRTPGPVFYRDPKVLRGRPAGAADPDLWTDAAVEIVDRQNLPRGVGADAPQTAAGKSEDVRSAAAVAGMLTGARRPPPTVTAIGMRVYLEQDPPPGQPKPKKATTGTNGLRRLEFLEQVLVHLWVDGNQSLGGPTVPGGAEPQRRSALAFVPPPPGLAAVAGAHGVAAYEARALDRALLQIETRGPFAYDAEKALARFDVVPQSDPNLPNDVQVTKVPARGGTSTLFSQVLELELNGPAPAQQPAANAGGRLAIKRLHAWTHTPGRFLTVASQDEAMQAYGQDLTHEQAAGRTVLTGSPLIVVRDRNVLSAGQPQRAATLTSEPGPGPARRTTATVRGAGRVELYDAATDSTSVTATWQTSLVQQTETVNGREQDLFTFTDGAKFEDPRSDFWLKGNVLKLWLEPRAATADASGQRAAEGQQKPAHVQAVGRVTSHSAEYDVERADLLNVFFADGKPQVAAAGAPKDAPKPLAGPLPPPKAVAGAKPPEPAAKPAERPKPPYKIAARTIDMWVNRVPVADPLPPVAAPAGNGAKPAPATKYQLDSARCEDDVTVHQDPIDPTKPRGVDVFGRLLLISGSPDGNKMTVHGSPNKPGEVHQEEMSLLGPLIVLDQVHNLASVTGRGALTMPTTNGLAGGELKQPEVVVIHWRDSMLFRGALRSAEFVGKVSARQGDSWVLCHTMHVTFDRPLFFNQAQKRGAGANQKAKIDTVACYPAAADAADERRELFVTYSQTEADATGKPVKTQQLTAQELTLEARATDRPGEDPFQRVKAFGPGTYRVWQSGARDPSAPAPRGAPVAPARPAPAGPAEQEMKLTVVTFTGRMTATDKGKVFQKAVFEENVEVVSVPAPDPTVEVQRHRLPPRGLLLTCDKELVVSSYKKGDAPPVQRMDATGNAYLRSDEYDGWGETITHDGKLIVLTGTGTIPAKIMGRFNRGTEQAGKQIVYDRGTGTYQVIESFGGSIGPSGPGAAPPPKK